MGGAEAGSIGGGPIACDAIKRMRANVLSDVVPCNGVVNFW